MCAPIFIKVSAIPALHVFSSPSDGQLLAWRIRSLYSWLNPSSCCRIYPRNNKTCGPTRRRSTPKSKSFCPSLQRKCGHPASLCSTAVIFVLTGCRILAFAASKRQFDKNGPLTIFLLTILPPAAAENWANLFVPF